MAKKELFYINCAVAGICILVLLLIFSQIMSAPQSVAVSDVKLLKKALPKNSFEQSSAAYGKIDSSLLTLKFAPFTMQLPDLKKHLLYYGKNGRPDAKLEKPLVHLAFNGNKQATPVLLNEKIYITFDKSQTPPQYQFSPGNQETPLSFLVKEAAQELRIQVQLKSPEGQIIDQPSALAEFSLSEKEFTRVAGNQWEIGSLRVDGSLLARQKARWYGADKFLERHGGAEYQEMAGKHRIDFGDGESAYSVFVGLQDVLIWKDNAWKNVVPGPESIGNNLMIVKKIDERLMNLEIWDPDGKSRMTLNLLKSAEVPIPASLPQSFKFVGARTRSQFVFEINQERMLLTPKDWLVFTDQGWIKLTTHEEIDNYVNRKLTGPLFIFDGLSKKDDRQVLLGTLFNASRTDMQNIELQVTQNTAKKGPEAPKDPKRGRRKPEELAPTPYAKMIQPSSADE